MTSPWTSQMGSLAGVSPPAGRAQHIRASAHLTAQAAGCRGQMGKPGWAPCRALESPESTASCFLSLQMLALGPRELSDSLQMATCWRAWHPLQGTCSRSGRRRQVAEPPFELALVIKPLCPTPLLCPIQWRALLSSPVLQVLVDGHEAEKAAEEPHGRFHQVCLGFCPGKRPASPPVSWGPSGFPPLGRCSESPVIGPVPVQGPCWAVPGARSPGLTAASTWMVVL